MRNNQHSEGVKLDIGKPRVGLVLGDFNKALMEVSRVGTFGASKYTDSGWKTVENGKERYTDAMMRHYLKDPKGGELDNESGLLHAAHTAWCALCRLEFILEERRKNYDK